MDQANWIIIPIAAFLPLILGLIWYHPSVLGTKQATLNGEPLKKLTAPKAVLIYLFSIFLAYVLTLMSIHQTAMFQLFFMDPELKIDNSEYQLFINDFLEKYGERHRSFGHGMVHGGEAGLFFGLAFLGITTLLQGKSLKQIWLHFVFWIVCCTLVGGVVCMYF